MKAESDRSSARGVILDLSRIVGTIPLMDMYVLGEHCSKVWKHSFRIALISLEVGACSLFDDVARNRGVQIAVVPNQSAAMEWLALH